MSRCTCDSSFAIFTGTLCDVCAWHEQQAREIASGGVKTTAAKAESDRAADHADNQERKHR